LRHNPLLLLVLANRRTACACEQCHVLRHGELGKSADFIVLTGNPLEDITNARRIDRVYLRGQAIDRAALKKSWTAQAGS